MNDLLAGVSHCDDLMYLFYFGDFEILEEKIMSDKMIDIWTKFASNQ